MRVLFVLSLLVSLAACAPSEAPAPATPADDSPSAATAEEPDYVVIDEATPPEVTVEEARAASKELMTKLKSKLVKSLQEVGPAGSIEVCSMAAPEIAASVQGDTMSVRRVSLKVRNPEDEPDAYERAVLERWAQTAATDRSAMPDELAEVVEMPGRGQVVRFMKPIYIAKPCLSCHGPEASLDDEVRAQLEELYPEDRATGYQDGELRGAVTVVADLG